MRRLGFIPGAIATGLTLAYAAKQIDQVGKLFLQAEKKGFTDKIQKVRRRPACQRAQRALTIRTRAPRRTVARLCQLLAADRRASLSLRR